MAAITIEEAAPHIKELLKQWGYDFEPGKHNEYVCHFGKVCVRYGIDKDEGDEVCRQGVWYQLCRYRQRDEIVLQAYRPLGYLALLPSRRGMQRQAEGEDHQAMAGYPLRVSAQHRDGLLRVEKPHDPQRQVSSLVPHRRQHRELHLGEMDEAGLHLSEKVLHYIINSDFSEPFDPLDDYLRSLPKWKKGRIPTILTSSPTASMWWRTAGLRAYQKLFRYFFKKWLVAMVVAWVILKVVNQFILIFVGKGGIFKTTFLAYLLPPSLRQYFFNDSTGNYTDKDFMEAFSSKATICLDEFETVFGKNLSAFKSNLTKLTFSIRRPYDKYRTELPHRASLCGTTNSQQFITDEENRRYCPWLVESIESPIDHPIDYDHVYAEAVALGQEVMKRTKSSPLEWTYWLTRDDIELMRIHNRLFMVANYAEEQILPYYKVPLPDTPLQFIKFRYSAEILEKIRCEPCPAPEPELPEHR